MVEELKDFSTIKKIKAEEEVDRYIGSVETDDARFSTLIAEPTKLMKNDAGLLRNKRISFMNQKASSQSSLH